MNYYTPVLEDFHVGFEFEYQPNNKLGHLLNPVWVKAKLGVTQEGTEVLPLTKIPKLLKEGRIRVENKMEEKYHRNNLENLVEIPQPINYREREDKLYVDIEKYIKSVTKNDTYAEYLRKAMYEAIKLYQTTK